MSVECRQGTDIIGRPVVISWRGTGGEEFAILLARTDQQGAYRVAYKLRAAIEGLGLPHPRSPVSDRLTISVGVASATPALDSTWEELELVAAADRAVVKAKEDGRNRVVAVISVVGRRQSSFRLLTSES